MLNTGVQARRMSHNQTQHRFWIRVSHGLAQKILTKKINCVMKPGELLVIWTPNVKNAIVLKEKWIG